MDPLAWINQCVSDALPAMVDAPAAVRLVPSPDSPPTSTEDAHRGLITTLIDSLVDQSPFTEPAAGLIFLSIRASRLLREVAPVLASWPLPEVRLARSSGSQGVAGVAEELAGQGLTEVRFTEAVNAGMPTVTASLREHHRQPHPGALAPETTAVIDGLPGLICAWLEATDLEWVEEYLETLSLQSASTRLILRRTSRVAPEPGRPPLTAQERAGLTTDDHDRQVAAILVGFMVVQQRARQLGMHDAVAGALGTQTALRRSLELLSTFAA